MTTALVVAVIAFVGALSSALLSWRAQVTVARLLTARDQATRTEERLSEARKVLDRYRAPLMDAAWQLGNRIDNIRHRHFQAFLDSQDERAQIAELSTLCRLAQYLGWREWVRREVLLLRFQDEEDTRLVAGLMNDVAWVLSTDGLDGGRLMLWADEQRAIGELMILDHERLPIIRGFSAFRSNYEPVFAPWMRRLSNELRSQASIKSDRLRLLQWALCDLAERLDEERTWGESKWMARAREEASSADQVANMSSAEARLRAHLAQSRRA